MNVGKSLDMAVDLAPGAGRGLRLRNPVMTAAGTFGYGIEYEGLTDIQRLGAVVCKTITWYPRQGNPPPRTVETPSGMLNSIGLQNIGLKAVVEKMAPVWAMWEVPVVVSIAGETVEEYAQMAAALEGVAGVSGLEVNIGCPNVKAGGMEFGADATTAARVTEAIKRATTLPVMVKLSPHVSDIKAIARAVADAGADALTLINTLRGMAIDVATRQPVLGNITGGLSGPAIKPVALQMVYEAAEAVAVPIIGCGGIASPADALEFLMAGATAIQIGTANFVDPRAALGVLAGIQGFMAQQGQEDIKALVGTAHRDLHHR